MPRLQLFDNGVLTPYDEDPDLPGEQGRTDGGAMLTAETVSRLASIGASRTMREMQARLSNSYQATERNGGVIQQSLPDNQNYAVRFFTPRDPGDTPDPGYVAPWDAIPSGPWRICPGCENNYPETSDYFYQRPGNGRFERCHSCRRRYYAEYRARRRAADFVPTRGTRRFGVEIEFIGSCDRVIEALRDADIACRWENYNHRTRRHWKIVWDASVGSAGGELVSPPLRGDAGRQAVRAVCEALSAAGATVNRSCGLHVHHEVKDIDVRSFGRIFRLWYNSQDAINKMVAKSRRDNRHCLPLWDREVEMCEGLTSIVRRYVRYHLGIDRYRAINAQSYPKYGTIEIRQHQGTCDAEKILAWVEFGQALINFARSEAEMLPYGLSPASLLGNLVEHAALSAETAEFLNERVRLLNRERTTVVA